MITLYLARAMSHRIKEDVVKESEKDTKFFTDAGFKVNCPVSKENIQPTKQKLLASKKALLTYWPEDKRMIRESNIVIDMSPNFNSEGVKHEIGYSRYCLWKPIVRIFPTGELPIGSSVSYLEDDYICDSLEEAVEYIYRVHGTFWKRTKWRLAMINRCLPKWLWYQIGEWK